MKNKILLIFLLFFSAFKLSLYAQGIQACHVPGGEVSSTCKNTCINCDLEGITGINNVPTPPNTPTSYCLGALVVNNPAWYGFIAGSTDLVLNITTANCSNNQGLEFAVLDNCEVPVACAPGPNPTSGPGQFTFAISGLTVGHPYQLLIDGFNGASCNYTIHVASGSAAAPPLGPLGAIQGLSQVCPNATTTYTIPPVANAITYFWTAPPGSSINGGLNTALFPATIGNNNTIEVAFGNTGGNICVTANNTCSPPVSTCLPVSNVPVPVHQLPDETVCYDQLPYEWPEEPHPFIGASGTFTLTSSAYTSYLGCDSMVRQTIKVLPIKQTHLPLRYLCKSECFEINGTPYCETGTYQEHISTDDGCDSVVYFTLIKIVSKAVVAEPDTITCAVTSVPLSGAGSTSGNTVTYQWFNPAGQVISNAITGTATAPGVYTFVVTNSVGGVSCRDTAFATVPGNLTPPQVDAGPDRVLTCLITQITLQGSGSTGSIYSYFWKAQLGGNIVSGATTLTPTINAPGTYTLRVTNNYNGCTAISSAVVVAQITPPTVTASGGTFTCNSPSITLQVSTNAASPTFAWTGPNNYMSSVQNPTVNVPGTYTVVVTNGVTGCTSSANAVVNAGNDTPDVTATGGAITCTQSTVTLGATSAVPGVTYQWSGPGSFSSNLQNPVVSVVGTYNVVVTSPNGCTNTGTAAVVLNNTLPGTTLAASGSLNCVNATVNVLATSNGNPANLTHAWTLPDGSNQNTGAVAFLPASVPGLYSVIVNNTASGCTSSASFTVVQYANVTAAIDKTENAKCSDSNDGSLSVLPAGGNGAYTYNWSNAASTAVNIDLGPGVYVVTVTDGEGCTATVTGTVTAPNAINTNATATAQTSNGASDGTATANPSGGTPGYTYVWSTTETTQSISGLLPGSYTVTVTDANGCTAVKTVNVNQFDCALQTELVSSNVSCSGANNGSATLNFLGGTSPFIITWSTGATTDTLQNLAPGQYSVSITDAANCPEIQTFTITEPQVLLANASGSTTTGVGTNDGTASANPTGGTGAYTYSWSNGESTATISNLAAGSYTVIVTDENDCTAQQTVEVLAGNCNLTTDLQITNPTCNGGSNGAATIVLTGGAGGFTYVWSSGGNAATETGLTAGTHTVSVTDANGCSISVEVTLQAPPAIVLSVDSNVATSCPNLAAGSLSILASGGTGVLSVLWSDGQTGLSATALVAGTYTAVVTDESGCTASISATVISNDTEAPVIGATDSNVPISPNGTVVLTPQLLTGDITDNCSLASVVFSPSEFNCTQLGVHDVTITATDNVGLTTTKTIVVTIIDDEDPTLICSPSLVLCTEDNPVSYQAPTASDNCLAGGVFHIIEGLAIGATFPLGSTTTTYSFTDLSGNVGTCSFEVTILTPLAIDVDTVINDVNFQNIGAAFITMSGSLPPYTYSWKLNGVQVSTQQNLTGVGAGVYTLEVTDDNGCTVTTQVTISNTSDTKNPIGLEDIRIFPNPTAGNLAILLPDALVGENVFLQVFDLTGRRMLEQTSLKDKQIDLSLLGFADGLYTLVLRVDNSQIVRKIVLSR